MCFEVGSALREMGRPGQLSPLGSCRVASRVWNAFTRQVARSCHKSPLVVTANIVTSFLVTTDMVTFSRALADPTRWRIVRLVMDEALCVCELADILEMPQSTVSSHVQIIRKAGLLESEKREKWTYFRIAAGHLKLLRTMERHLGGGDDEEERGDAERSARRLAEREGSCCPGPVRLRSRKARISTHCQ